MATTDREVLIAEFQRLLGNKLSDAGCAFFLDMNNWQVFYLSDGDYVQIGDLTVKYWFIERLTSRWPVITTRTPPYPGIAPGARLLLRLLRSTGEVINARARKWTCIKCESLMQKISHFIHRHSELVFTLSHYLKYARVHQRRSTKCNYQTWFLLICFYLTKYRSMQN